MEEEFSHHKSDILGNMYSRPIYNRPVELLYFILSFWAKRSSLFLRKYQRNFTVGRRRSFLPSAGHKYHENKEQMDSQKEWSIISANGSNGPLARYVKLRVAHASRMPETFFPPPRVSYPDMRHGTCVTHMPWCMSGSLTSCCFEVGGGENVPGIYGAWATRNFANLKRGQLQFISDFRYDSMECK